MDKSSVETDLKNVVLHGNCLELMHDIPDGSIDMILCDLPYGTTACSWDTIIPFEPLWYHYKRIIKPNGAIVLTASQPFTSKLVMSNLEMFKYCWYWDKVQGTGFLNSQKQPLKNCEEIIIFYSSQATYNPQMRKGFMPYSCKKGGNTEVYNKDSKPVVIATSDGNRYPLTIIEFSRDKERSHPTQKPVALFEYLIKTYTDKGDLVLDNCAGSGTTGEACIKTDRDYILIEQEQKFIDIINKRIDDATRQGRLF